MMGLSRREAERRLDAVLDFAELREFSDLKLKNYSSGMMVRLAFSVMVEADADIMLVDEVLAVGDAAFAQKCMDVFREKRRGRADDRARHPRHGHRPGLLRPRRCCCTTASCSTSATRRRPRCATTGSTSAGREHATAAAGGVPDVNVRVADAWLEDAAGEQVENVEQGEPIGLDVVFEARHDLDGPVFGFHFAQRRRRARCSASTATLDAEPDRRRGGPAGADLGPDREPAAAGALLRQLLDLAQPRRRATSRCTSCACSTSSSTARGRAPGSVAVRGPTSRRRLET